jgi:hypothetical protein
MKVHITDQPEGQKTTLQINRNQKIRHHQEALILKVQEDQRIHREVIRVGEEGDIKKKLIIDN